MPGTIPDRNPAASASVRTLDSVRASLDQRASNLNSAAACPSRTKIADIISVISIADRRQAALHRNRAELTKLVFAKVTTVCRVGEITRIFHLLCFDHLVGNPELTYESERILTLKVRITRTLTGLRPAPFLPTHCLQCRRDKYCPHRLRKR